MSGTLSLIKTHLQHHFLPALRSTDGNMIGFRTVHFLGSELSNEWVYPDVVVAELDIIGPWPTRGMAGLECPGLRIQKYCIYINFAVRVP